MNRDKAMEIMWAEMKPDCYGGETCDQIVPMWECFALGDVDSDHSSDDIVLDPKLFPAGTKISVTVPLCPECSEQPDICDCGFDWESWTVEQYS